MFASHIGHFEIAHFLEKYIDPNSSSYKLLEQSINQLIESTSSVIMVILKIQKKKSTNQQFWNRNNHNKTSLYIDPTSIMYFKKEVEKDRKKR